MFFFKFFYTFLFLFLINNQVFGNSSKNLIFFSDVQNDEFYQNVGIDHLFTMDGYQSLLNKYGFVIKIADGQYKEYIFDIQNIDEQYGDFFGNIIMHDLSKNTKQTVKFENRSQDLQFYVFVNDKISYFLQMFKGGDLAVWYESSGNSCFNEQNPQCNKFIGEEQIIGFTDRENNFTYEQLVKIYKEKLEEEKRVVEEEKRIKEQKLAEENKRLEEEQRERQRIYEQEIAKEEEERKKREAYEKTPERLLFKSYQSYITIKKFHDASILYVDYDQMSDARSQIKEIEKKLLELDNSINENILWEQAVSDNEQSYDANIMSIAKTNPTSQFEAIAKLSLLSLEEKYNQIIGSQPIEKDF